MHVDDHTHAIVLHEPSAPYLGLVVSTNLPHEATLSRCARPTSRSPKLYPAYLETLLSARFNLCQDVPKYEYEYIGAVRSQSFDSATSAAALGKLQALERPTVVAARGHPGDRRRAATLCIRSPLPSGCAAQKVIDNGFSHTMSTMSHTLGIRWSHHHRRRRFPLPELQSRAAA